MMDREKRFPSDFLSPQATISNTISREFERAHGLQLALLGTPIITWLGRNLSISRRQVRALLYRLATHLQPVAREQLCFLFWSDETHSNARRKLTHLLTHLRLALPEPDLVEITNEYVALDVERVHSDTLLFDQLAQEVQKLAPPAANHAVDVATTIENLEQLVQIYRGPFLSGFSLSDCHEFEAWITQEREVYGCRYLEALDQLIDYYYEKKEYEAAIIYAKQYLETDNLAEEIHCRLMELYALIGDRSAAERQFEQCTILLEQELGSSPSPKTWAMYHSLSGTRLPANLLPGHRQIKVAFPGLEIPFIGRQDLLDQIDQAINLANLGRGRMVLIQGEPGIGKTRLLQYVASKHNCNAIVLFGACTPGMQNLPYHPLAEMLRSALEDQSLNIKSNSLWLTEAARLLPEIYLRYPNLPPPLPSKPDEAQRRLYESLYQLTINLPGRARPLLLCLDDIHWADANTLEWLIYLGERLVSDGVSHVLVLCTCWSDEHNLLTDLKLALTRLGVLVEHRLVGFENNEILQIVNRTFGTSINNQALADKLHKVSGGNPFFLLETIRAMIESQSIPRNLIELENLPIPKSVNANVQQRLLKLNSKERMILEMMAVLNRPFTLEMAQWALGLSDMEITESLERLSNLGLIAEHEGLYTFCHDLVGMVVYSDLSYARKRFLHRQCGRILEELKPGELQLLAWHFERCGEPGKAAEYALQAGEQSYRNLAFNNALNYFSRALNMLRQEAATLSLLGEIHSNYRKQILTLSLQGDVLRALGEMQAYQSAIEEQAQLAAAMGDQEAQAQVLIRQADAYRWFCRYEQAIECAQKALQISRKTRNTLLQAKALREIGLAKIGTAEFDQAQTALDEAFQLFKAQDEPAEEIATLSDLSIMFASQGDFYSAERAAVNALGRCEQAQLPAHRRLALAALGVALIGLGQISQGKDCLVTSLEIARQLSDRSQEIFCLNQLGWLENHSGNLDEALAYFRDGLAIAERLDSRAEQSQLYAGIAETHRRLGNRRLGYSFVIKSIELAKQHHRPYDLSLAQQILSKFDGNL